MDPLAVGRAILKFPDCAPKGQGGTMHVWAHGVYSCVRIVTPTQPHVEMGQEGGDSQIKFVWQDRFSDDYWARLRG